MGSNKEKAEDFTSEIARQDREEVGARRLLSVKVRTFHLANNDYLVVTEA
jgi:hypothetical protein